MEAPFPGCPELSAWHAHSLLANQAPARRQALKRSSSGEGGTMGPPNPKHRPAPKRPRGPSILTHVTQETRGFVITVLITESQSKDVTRPRRHPSSGPALP